MRPLRCALLVVPILSCSLPGQAAARVKAHPDEIALKPKIDKAIGDGVEHLFDRQLRDGSWGVQGDQVGGLAGLCVYALLKSGVQREHPAMRRAFAYLDAVTPDRTYATACMLLAYEATADEKYRPRMQALLDKLVEWQRPQGYWGYPGSAADLSNTQYAALGLWAANKAGLKIPPKVWTDLIDGVFEHRESPRSVDVEVTAKTGAGRVEIAGFGYRPGSKATGSMTTAGVSILKICEIGLGKKLRNRRKVTDGIDSGLRWLAVNFAVDRNPGMGGGRVLYYLYGMERVGSLTRKEEFGGHRWYLEGARHLLKQQKEGGWGEVSQTCFALLFLRRATDMGRPTSGPGNGSSKLRHVFAAGDDKADIKFRGAGQQPLALYIDGFGQRLIEQHARYGLRILRVEYLENGRKLGELAADPTKAWTGDTFVHRCPALPRGEHQIVARVVAVAPQVPAGSTAETVTIESKPMQVTIRDVLEPWMAGVAQLQQGSVLRGLGVKFAATSNDKDVKHLTDGKDSTTWLCGPADDRPAVAMDFPRTVRARQLVITQAVLRDADLERVGVIEAVEVAYNKSKRFERIKLHQDPLAPTVIEFPQVRALRSLTLRVAGRRGEKDGKPLPVGFAEIVLSDPRRR